MITQEHFQEPSSVELHGQSAALPLDARPAADPQLAAVSAAIAGPAAGQHSTAVPAASPGPAAEAAVATRVDVPALVQLGSQAPDLHPAPQNDVEAQLLAPGPQPQPGITTHPPQLGVGELLFWLGIAAVQPCFVALLGVLTRYLEVKTTPGIPPLRITCQILLFSLPALLCFYTLPRHLYLRRQKARQQNRKLCRAATGKLKGVCGAAHISSGSSSSSLGSEDEAPCGAGPPGAAAVAGLARVPTLPGLSRVYDRHPLVHRVFVLLAVSSSYLAVILLLTFAPLMVDPSVIMLITLFTVVGVALVGRLWLAVPLPLALPPTAVVMIGGAVMIVVPNIKNGAGTAGSLTTGRAWLGFGLSIGALVLTVAYITLLQAFKHAKLGAEEVMYWLSGLCAVTVLPISLGVDGTDWGTQFRGMTGADWAALLFCVLVAHNGSVLGIQWATAKLGGNTVAIFMGFRLIASIVASKLILGATIVKTGMQVAGVALVALSITTYMGIQWWEARTRQPSAAARH